MLALSLWQPFASAIVLGFKPVENRGWAPPVTAVGQILAIHAAKKAMDDEDLEDVVDTAGHPKGFTRAQWLKFPTATTFGAVIGVVRLVRVAKADDPIFKTPAFQPWFNGPWGWIVDQPVALPRPVPCVGRQKLFRLPTDVYEAVQAQLQRPLWSDSITG